MDVPTFKEELENRLDTLHENLRDAYPEERREEMVETIKRLEQLREDMGW